MNQKDIDEIKEGIELLDKATIEQAILLDLTKGQYVITPKELFDALITEINYLTADKNSVLDKDEETELILFNEMEDE